MRWVITKDHTEPPDTAGAMNDVGWGQDDRGALVRLDIAMARVRARDSDMVPFKLYDDDGELYYEGASRDLGEEEERAFAPLDWAMRNAGCTRLDYLKNGKWETL